MKSLNSGSPIQIYPIFSLFKGIWPEISQSEKVSMRNLPLGFLQRILSLNENYPKTHEIFELIRRIYLRPGEKIKCFPQEIKKNFSDLIA